MKRTLIISLLLLFTYSIQAKKVELQTAQNVGLAYYLEHACQFIPIEQKAISVTTVYTEFENALPLYYVFSISPKGFIIVSADDNITPVLGYSYESDFKANKLAESFQYWLAGIRKTVVDVITNNIAANTVINNLWNYYKTRNANNLTIKKDKVIAPLCTSKWNQDKYYNQDCPAAIGGPDNKAYAGCVATSMGQIMYYYRYPDQGQGLHAGINFGTTTYNWDNMLDDLGNYNDAIATLLYHAGKSVNMSYAADGSGAQTSDCPSALKNYFKYNSTCNYASYDFGGYTQTTWQNLIKSNLDLGHPMIYSGYTTGNSGHAWVCDGYDASDNFHMNWGWSGQDNGYFAITNLTAGGYTFSEGHGLVYNFYPPSTSYPSNCMGTKTINFSSGTIEDGSGSGDYQNNQDCLWLIDPSETVANITLSFISLATEPTNDIITVYDGNSTSSPVLGTYSGSTLPNNITSTGPQMLIRFQTNGSTVDNGWKASYRSNYPVYCSGLTTLTTNSGTISDGSASDNYTYHQICRWSISPDNATSITLSFSAFNLATNDSLRVYDQVTNLKVASYSGTMIPATHTYNTSKLYLLFMTDGYLNSQGFDAAYNATLAGMEENENQIKFSVSPNPINDFINLNIKNSNAGNCLVTIYALDGRSVYSETFVSRSSVFVKSLDVSFLKSGLYLLSLTNGGERYFYKIIKE